MENNLDNVLLQLKNHERKSRILTLLLVFLFIACSVALYFFARSYNKVITVNHIQADSIVYLNRIAKFATSDSSKDIEIKRLTVLGDDLKKELLNCGNILQLPAASNNVKKMKTDIKRILISTSIVLKPQKYYSVYIQYNDSSNVGISKISKIRNELKSIGYVVPKEELITNNYKTSVRYFHDEDLMYAKEVLVSVNKLYKNAALQKSNIKAPTKQIEIWLNNNND